MKACFPLVLLAISFALPTYAQEKDLADPQTTQKLLALSRVAAEKALIDHDAEWVTAGFTRDAVFSYAGGTHHRSASHSEMVYKPVAVVAPQNSIIKVDGNAFHWIGTAGNALWATGEYSETIPGKTGEPPIPVHSYNFWLLVREGEDWNIQVDA